ncbi:MAG: succinyl-diaminopimelate desuccinylase [Gaiellaceae bacterium]|nr:MAG: succinyl-diaminopimelate desuccinylase [Gaiellaceae bacterium]
MRALADRLAARTLELVDIPSESGDEARIRERLLELVPPSLALEYRSDDAAFFVPARRTDAPLVTLVGHYDTVPAQGNLPGRIADGRVHGLGASDMKGGLAVALELVRDLAEVPHGRADVALLLFGKEELPYEHDPLPELFARSRAIHETALAIVLEPTAGRIQAGCLGNLIARLVFHGRSGHSARPWLADSALARAVEGIRPLLAHPSREVVVEGLTFVEVLAVTRLQAGIADNVIPGEASATVNFRYAPNRSPTEAEAALRALLPDGVEVEVASHAPAGRVTVASPLVLALRAAAGLAEVEPKQAWTNVADFTAHGIDAVNFGPGDPAFAHRRDEQVEVAALVRCYEVLRELVTASAPIGEDGG